MTLTPSRSPSPLLTLPRPRAILFDLDGTLADTAPDLAAAINRLRTSRGLTPTAYSTLRAAASSGGRGLIGASFGMTPEDDGYRELLAEFLESYQGAMAVDSGLFDGIAPLLQALRTQGLGWGVVTNKHARFTDTLVGMIGLGDADCVISGDTTPHAKPHPQPLFEAARRMSLPPHECWYVGDDLRDIQAGRLAGMATFAAAWGYAGTQAPLSWGADCIVDSPQHLWEQVRTALGMTA